MEITPPMLSSLGWASFLVFAGLNFLTIPIVWAFYPETSSKTLEELDIVFSTKSILVFKAEKELKELQANGHIVYGDGIPNSTEEKKASSSKS